MSAPSWSTLLREALATPSVRARSPTRPLQPESLLQVRLVFKPGDANVTELPISQDEIVIGRGRDCDIVLNDKKSSRRNSTIVRQGLTFVIRDLGSSNGTYVNGERVTERELAGKRPHPDRGRGVHLPGGASRL